MSTPVWPLIPFVALRGAQIFFAIIVLGLSGHIGSVYSVSSSEYIWSTWFALVTALFTLIGSGFLTVAFFMAPALTAPMITVIVDAFLFLFWLISLAGFANSWSSALTSGSNSGYSYSYGYGGYYYNPILGEVKGNMAMIVFEFLLFLGTLVFSILWIVKERRGDTKAGNPEAGSAGAFAGTAPTTHGTYPMQQQPAGYPPTAAPAPGQYPTA